MPLFWVGGLIISLLLSLVSGARVLCEDRTPTGFAPGSVPNHAEPEALNAATVSRGILYWSLGMTETLGPCAWGDGGREALFPISPPLVVGLPHPERGSSVAAAEDIRAPQSSPSG
jgi:hypothetical protein